MDAIQDALDIIHAVAAYLEGANDDIVSAAEVADALNENRGANGKAVDKHQVWAAYSLLITDGDGTDPEIMNGPITKN